MGRGCLGLEPRREGVRSVTQIWLLELTAGEREGPGVTCWDDRALRNDRERAERCSMRRMP